MGLLPLPASSVSYSTALPVCASALYTLTLNSMMRLRRRLSPSAPPLPPPEDTEHGSAIHQEEADAQEVGQR